MFNDGITTTTTTDVSWKGRTYNEIVSTIKRNKNKNASSQNTFLPNPCKIYRRELPIPFSVDNINSGSERTSLKLGDFPGSTTRVLSILGDYCNTPSYNNLIIQKPYDAPTDTTLKGEIDDTTIINSIRRVRSSGMNNEKPVFISNVKIGTRYYINQPQFMKSTVDNCNIYNPNNGQFSQQGAVSYSNYILRKNFDINRANNEITSATYSLPLLYAETIKNAVGDTGTLCSNNLPNKGNYSYLPPE
jgi:hypothetical protein